MVKKFGNFVANDNLTFNVYPGEIFGFLGANGAGKTTAIKILCGLLQPTAGEITVAGYDVYTQREEIKHSIGYMSQKFTLYEDLTVYENFRFYGGIYKMKRKAIRNEARSYLNRLSLEEQKNTLIKSVPLGWKQKLAFSVAVFHNPRVVFLDEPTGGVDPIARRQFWDLIYETAARGITVFVTTHYMDEAEYCNRISIMAEGKIKAIGNPDELKSEYKVRSMDELFVKIARNKE
ncbi:MAG: ABC transporter ATP-binding protein [Bacteroidota bacterium]